MWQKVQALTRCHGFCTVSDKSLFILSLQMLVFPGWHHILSSPKVIEHNKFANHLKKSLTLSDVYDHWSKWIWLFTNIVQGCIFVENRFIRIRRWWNFAYFINCWRTFEGDCIYSDIYNKHVYNRTPLARKAASILTIGKLCILNFT